MDEIFGSIDILSGSRDYPDRTPEEIKADLERSRKEQQKFNAHKLVKDLKAMKENKYYTPNIEEFHHGFEYEFERIYFHREEPERTGEWISGTFNVANPILSSIITRDVEGGYVRVKYLDQEDIESLGWDYSFQHGIMDLHEFVLRSYRLKIWFHSKKFPTIEIYNDLDNVIFTGTVKNKNRLSLVMEMIGIV